MSDLLKRIDLSQLYPPLRAKIEQLVKNCHDKGVDYWAICGLRSVAEQDALYAQGRSKPGKIVTKAKGGQSYHNFGLAVDFCKDKDINRAGLQPDWDVEGYRILAEEAAKLGLEAGYYWKGMQDPPHIQVPLASIFGKKDSFVLAEFRSKYSAGGNSAVWEMVDLIWKK